MRKLFRQIHLWLSVPFGLIIALICFSGAMLVFENEVNELTRPELYRVTESGDEPLPIEQLLEKVATTLPDSVSVTGVTISPDPQRPYQVSLSKPRRASVFVDQYTGEIKGKSGRTGFFMMMFRLHRWLLDSMNPGNEGIFWGKMIVGVSTLLFVFVLISGIVSWWPRTRRALKNSLKISTTKGWRRFWYDLHVAGGMYALVFLLVMALTGLTWSFPWYRTAFYTVFGVEMKQNQNAAHTQGGAGQNTIHRETAHVREKKENSKGEGNGRRKGEDERNGHLERNERPERNGQEQEFKGSLYTNWQKVYEQLSLQNPEYKQISISLSLGSGATASVSFNRFGNQRASDRYYFNPRSGEITETNLYQHQDKSNKIRGWIYSVHVGNWGGMLTRILAFIAALIGTALPLTGYYLWIKKLVNKRRRERNLNLNVAA